jgi:hypothetical protein
MYGPSLRCKTHSLWQISRTNPEGRSNKGTSSSEIKSFIFILSLGGWLLVAIWSVSNVEARTQSFRSVSRGPITVIDEVEHLPAPSWKTIPLSLPYSGSVTINVQVVRGNPIDVILITPDQFERVKRGEWKKIKATGDLRQTHTKSYEQSTQITRGEYYLVIGDRYLGEPPLPPTDIAVKVRLNSSIH